MHYLIYSFNQRKNDAHCESLTAKQLLLRLEDYSWNLNMLYLYSGVKNKITSSVIELFKFINAMSIWLKQASHFKTCIRTSSSTACMYTYVVTGHTVRMCNLYNSCPTRADDKPDIVQPSHTEGSEVMSKARVWECVDDQALQHCIFIIALPFFSHRDTWTMSCFMEVLPNLMT